MTVSQLALDQISSKKLEVIYANYCNRVTSSLFVAAALQNIMFDSPNPIGTGTSFPAFCGICKYALRCQTSTTFLTFANLHKRFEDP